jgi:hypothetical protein
MKSVANKRFGERHTHTHIHSEDGQHSNSGECVCMYVHSQDGQGEDEDEDGGQQTLGGRLCCLLLISLSATTVLQRSSIKMQRC